MSHSSEFNAQQSFENAANQIRSFTVADDPRGMFASLIGDCTRIPDHILSENDPKKMWPFIEVLRQASFSLQSSPTNKLIASYLALGHKREDNKDFIESFSAAALQITEHTNVEEKVFLQNFLNIAFTSYDTISKPRRDALEATVALLKKSNKPEYIPASATQRAAKTANTL